jgi:UPF0716 protein FxsA
MIRLRWLVLGVIALPFVEFAAFWWVAGRIGFFAALLSVIATSLLGVAILKGGARLLFAELATGRVVLLNETAARSGMLTAFAGLLLAIPGFVTDLIALFLLLPVLKDLLLGGHAVAHRRPGHAPAPPGVVDLDPGDWREESGAGGPRRPPRLDRD